jgi:hypothetical protein
MKRFFFVFLFALTALFFTACSSSDDDNGGGGGGNGIGSEAGEFPNLADITGFPASGYSSTVIHKTYRAANKGAAFTDYIDAWEKNFGSPCDRSDPTNIHCSGTDTVESVIYSFEAYLLEYEGTPVINVNIYNRSATTTTPDEGLFDSLPSAGSSLVSYGYDYTINFADTTALAVYQGALEEVLENKDFTKDAPDPDDPGSISYSKKSGNKIVEVWFEVSGTFLYISPTANSL